MFGFSGGGGGGGGRVYPRGMIFGGMVLYEIFEGTMKLNFCTKPVLGLPKNIKYSVFSPKQEPLAGEIIYSRDSADVS